MKHLVLIVAPFLTLSAFAGPMLPAANVTLTRVVTNGTVAAPFQKTVSCTISAGQVAIETTGPMIDFPYTLHKQAVYNTDVPNDSVMESLASDATRGTVTHAIGPIGGGLTTYRAVINQGSLPAVNVVLKSLTGGLVSQNNTSSAAAKLDKFIDLNCK